MALYQNRIKIVFRLSINQNKKSVIFNLGDSSDDFLRIELTEEGNVQVLINLGMVLRYNIL